MDITLEVDVYMIPIDIFMPNQSTWPSGTSIPLSSQTPSSYFALYPLYHILLLLLLLGLRSPIPCFTRWGT